MDNNQLLQELFDPKVLALLKLFFKNSEREYYLLEASKETGVSSATTFRIVGKLAELGILETIKMGKFKLYRLNHNSNVEFLQAFIREDIQVLKDFVNQIQALPGIEAIILHGKESSNRANLLMIGENIDAAKMKELSAAAKDKYDFNISSLTLTRDQYAQMSNMGLYSGQKKVLYERPQTS